MSINEFRQSKRHRSMPVQEGIVRRCNNATVYAPPRREIENSRSDTETLCHLSRLIVSSNSLFFIFGSSVISQIPIGRCLL